MTMSNILNRVTNSETITKNETDLRIQMNRMNFLKKHKDFFIIGFIILTGLAFWLTIAYFDEGYNRFPVDGVDYFFVILYALFFPIIPVVLFYLIFRSYQKK